MELLDTNFVYPQIQACGKKKKIDLMEMFSFE